MKGEKFLNKSGNNITTYRVIANYGIIQIKFAYEDCILINKCQKYTSEINLIGIQALVKRMSTK